MTKTERTAARLVLVEKQRRFAWELARQEFSRSAGRMVSGKTHDLLGLVQIVQLATPQLTEHSAPEMKEFIDDIARAADDAHVQLTTLMAIARPPKRAATGSDGLLVRGAAVGPIIGRVIGELDAAVDIGVDYAIDVDAATALDEVSLAHLAIGLVLDALDARWIELTVRDREINGAPWIELVRGTEDVVEGDHFDLRLVEALATRVHGDVAQSERRGGGLELVVALPAVA